MTIAELIDILSKGGLLAGLVVFIVALWRRWLVWSGEYRDLVKDRDWWRSIALSATGLAEIATRGKKSDESS